MEGLAKAATPGEWIARKRGVSVACGLPNDEVTYPVASCKNDISERHEQLADAAYIAAANPQAILSLLAEHRQLIERVEVLEGAADDKFDAGYLIATANLMHLHGEDTLAEDVLKEHNALDVKSIKRLKLTDYDAKVLRPLFREIDRKAKLPPRKALGANS